MPEAPIHIEFAYTADDYAEGRRRSADLYPKQAHSYAWMAFIAAAAIGGPMMILSNPTDHQALVYGGMLTAFGMWSLYAWAAALWRFCLEGSGNSR